MSFDVRINQIFTWFNNNISSLGTGRPTFEEMKADIINNISTAKAGNFLLTYYNTRTGEQQTEWMSLFSNFTKLYSHEYTWDGKQYEEGITEGAYHPISKLRFNLIKVKDCLDYFNDTNIPNPYTGGYMTKQQLLETYGEYYCFDFVNNTPPTGANWPGLYIESWDARHTLEGVCQLKIGATYIPLANSWTNTQIPDDSYWIRLTGSSRVTAVAGAITGNYDFYNCYYYAIKGGSRITIPDYSAFVTTTSGHNTALFDPDVIDALIEDLDNIGINIQLSSGPEPGPEPGEGIPTEPGQPNNDIDNQGGTGDWTINKIDKPITPGAGASLFGNTYLLTLNQLKGISNLFFSDNAISALLTHASDSEILSAFRGAMIWPFDFDDLEVPQLTAQYIKMGTLSVGNGTTTVSEINAGTTVDIDFGTLTLQNRYGGFLDYHPFTQMVIYLPFCGFKDIDPADVYGHTLHLYYLVDIESGAGKACIDVDDIPMMEYPCQLGIPISFNINNMYEKARNAVLGVVNSFTGAATVGTIDIHKDEKGKVLGIGSNPTNAVTHLMGGLASTAINTAMTKTNFTSMGGVGNGVERQQPMYAYIITKTINTAVPTNYNSRFGRPSLMVKQLSEEVGKGFTTIINPQLDLNCTEEEKNYIISNLENGVYL